MWQLFQNAILMKDDLSKSNWKRNENRFAQKKKQWVIYFLDAE